MVMEASPSPQSVGREFVRQYYTLLNKAPAHLHRFYNNYSSFVHGGLDAPNHETPPVVGQKQIHHRIQQLNFRDCHAKISQVDSQATLGNGVVVQVTGELSNGGAPMRRFTQTFVLAAQSPKKYYVHNDIFRYQDIVFSDEEAEASGRSDGEEEDPAGGGGAAGGGVYFGPSGGAFPPPPSAFPAPPAPSPPPAPQPAPLSHVHAAPPAHLNGHPPAHDLVAAMHASSISGAGSEPDGDVGGGASGELARDEPAPQHSAPPDTEREPTPVPTPPPPRPVSPPAPVSTEPKTYANLLKSGGAASGGSAAAAAGGGGVAARVSPPAPAAHPAPEPRPRPQRAPRDTQPQGERGGSGGGGGRYPDAQQLFLGNLPLSATEEELRAVFARYGPVAELRVHSKPAAPGQPRYPNYGFITYETAHAAALCLNAAPLYFPVEGSAEGVKLNVEEKKARGRDPPRRRPHSSHRAYPPRAPNAPANYRR